MKTNIVLQATNVDVETYWCCQFNNQNIVPIICARDPAGGAPAAAGGASDADGKEEAKNHRNLMAMWT